MRHSRRNRGDHAFGLTDLNSVPTATRKRRARYHRIGKREFERRHGFCFAGIGGTLGE